MNFFDELDALLKNDDIINENDVNKIDISKVNISLFSDEMLCSTIVCERVLKINSRQIDCMKELSLRRQNGSTFQFEDFIDSKMKEFPKQEIVRPQFEDISSQISFFMKQKR